MITTGWATIGTAPTLIDGREVNPFRLIIHNNDNTDAVYIGNQTVTATTGLRLMKEETLELTINPLEAVYAVSTKAGHTISWFKQTEV